MRLLIGVVVVVSLASACDRGSSKHAGSTSTSTGARPTASTIVLRSVRPKKSDCAPNAANDAITGAFATASAIGWAGNAHGVVTCLGGRFFVAGDVNRAFGFGIYGGGPTTWVDADGYLPAQITSFHRAGAAVTITELADRVVIGGRAFVAV